MFLHVSVILSTGERVYLHMGRGSTYRRVYLQRGGGLPAKEKGSTYRGVYLQREGGLPAEERGSGYRRKGVCLQRGRGSAYRWGEESAYIGGRGVCLQSGRGNLPREGRLGRTIPYPPTPTRKVGSTHPTGIS